MPATVLPFPARPTQTTTKPKKKSAKKRVAKKKGKATPASRGVSFTLRVDAKEIADELKKQIRECEDNH